jgi:hypothetical protein
LAQSFDGRQINAPFTGVELIEDFPPSFKHQGFHRQLAYRCIELNLRTIDRSSLRPTGRTLPGLPCRIGFNHEDTKPDSIRRTDL